jgi:quercetin dioxygenase-like cupin family protein
MFSKANWDTIPEETARAGVTRKVFSGKNSMMVLNKILPSASPALHHHPHEQLTYILEGESEFVLGDEVLNLKAGDVVLVPPDVPHSSKTVSAIPVLNLDIFSPIRDDYLRGTK